MADNVIELTTSRLSDPVLADMAGILGLEESRARKAVEQSAAVIVAGMLRTSATLAGSESLLETLARSRGDLGLSRDLESVLASREMTRQLQQSRRRVDPLDLRRSARRGSLADRGSARSEQGIRRDIAGPGCPSRRGSTRRVPRRLRTRARPAARADSGSVGVPPSIGTRRIAHGAWASGTCPACQTTLRKSPATAQAIRPHRPRRTPRATLRPTRRSSWEPGWPTGWCQWSWRWSGSVRSTG